MKEKIDCKRRDQALICLQQLSLSKGKFDPFVGYLANPYQDRFVTAVKGQEVGIICKIRETMSCR
jgi:hypothetical protein